MTYCNDHGHGTNAAAGMDIQGTAQKGWHVKMGDRVVSLALASR